MNAEHFQTRRRRRREKLLLLILASFVCMGMLLGIYFADEVKVAEPILWLVFAGSVAALGVFDD